MATSSGPALVCVGLLRRRGLCRVLAARHHELARARILERTSSARLRRFICPWALDLSTKSSAPSSRPRSVTSAPSCVRDDMRSTGTRRMGMRRSSVSRPSSRGILTSRVMTSGSELLGHLQAFETVPRLADDLDVRLAAEHAHEGLPHEDRVVDDQNADLRGRGAHGVAVSGFW